MRHETCSSTPAIRHLPQVTPVSQSPQAWPRMVASGVALTEISATLGVDDAYNLSSTVQVAWLSLFLAKSKASTTRGRSLDEYHGASCSKRRSRSVTKVTSSTRHLATPYNSTVSSSGTTRTSGTLAARRGRHANLVYAVTLSQNAIRRA